MFGDDKGCRGMKGGRDRNRQGQRWVGVGVGGDWRGGSVRTKKESSLQQGT